MKIKEVINRLHQESKLLVAEKLKKGKILKAKINETKNIDLPSMISKKISYQYFSAVAIFVLSLIAVIHYKNAEYLTINIVAIYLISQAISIKVAWKEGHIVERAVRCTSTKYNKIKRTTTATMMDIESNTYYEFLMQGNAKNFYANANYIIYINTKCPKEIIAYLQI